jgi:hypothetical protein
MIFGQFSGRTLIFSNSIDGVKKITNFLTTLRLPAKALHAQVIQTLLAPAVRTMQGFG